MAVTTIIGLDHHLDHRVGWVERSETQHFVFVGFRSSTQPTFHALAEIMIKAQLLHFKFCFPLLDP